LQSQYYQMIVHFRSAASTLLSIASSVQGLEEQLLIFTYAT